MDPNLSMYDAKELVGLMHEHESTVEPSMAHGIH